MDLVGFLEMLFSPGQKQTDAWPGAFGGHLELKVAWKVSQGRKEMPQHECHLESSGHAFQPLN